MSLMMMRAALIARNALPPQYQRVEYLESTGNQSINTGIAVGVQQVADYLSVKMKFSITERNAGETGIFGGKGSQNQSPVIFLISNSYYLASWCDSGYTWAMQSINQNDIVNMTMKFKKDYGREYINGSLSIVNNTVNNRRMNVINGGNYCVFCDGSQPTNYAKMKLYGNFTMTIDGEIKFNGITCRRKSDNKPGMWDTVSKTFFTNSRTGADFTLGPDVL